MTRCLAVLLLLAVTPISASTQSVTATTADPRQLAAKAMTYLANEDLKGMFTFMRKQMLRDEAEADSVMQSTIKQRADLAKELGPYLGYAFIDECRRSDFLSRVTYIEKRGRTFLRWRFYFYKPQGTWHITSFAWDNRPTESYELCN